MIYCKNCGRQLKEGARFCDRCGQSVRKTTESSQAAKRREIEELKAERLNRKKRLAEKEAKQERTRNKKRQNRRGGVLIFIIVVILIAVVSIIIGYNIFPHTGEISLSNETDNPVSTAVARSASATQTPVSKEKYSEITVGNITCPYPSGFYTNTVSGNEVLNITDSLGGGKMIVAKEAKSGEIKELIKDYISEIGATDNPEMHAGSDWYSVTATVSGKVYHRKCIVRNGLAVYYDFTYDASSTSAKKYEEYISYIDSKFS